MPPKKCPACGSTRFNRIWSEPNTWVCKRCGYKYTIRTKQTELKIFIYKKKT